MGCPLGGPSAFLGTGFGGSFDQRGTRGTTWSLRLADGLASLQGRFFSGCSRWSGAVLEALTEAGVVLDADAVSAAIE